MNSERKPETTIVSVWKHRFFALLHQPVTIPKERIMRNQKANVEQAIAWINEVTGRSGLEARMVSHHTKNEIFFAGEMSERSINRILVDLEQKLGPAKVVATANYNEYQWTLPKTEQSKQRTRRVVLRHGPWLISYQIGLLDHSVKA